MNTIRYGKRSGWIAPIVILLCLFAVITAQPGFLSISCGGKTNYTAENNITWVTDAGYIDVGHPADIGDASYMGSYLHSLRYFPEPLNKSCYHLPVASDVPYLLRLWFVPGNFSQVQQSSFTFSIETVDMLHVESITSGDLPYSDPPYSEKILVTSGRVLCICLVRTSAYYDPFISAIELRRLQDGMYHDAKPGQMLILQPRYDFGGTSTIRHPQDKFDRIWKSTWNSYLLSSDTYFDDYFCMNNISSKEPISTNNTKNLPPTAVMQTACIVNSSDSFSLYPPTSESVLLLYFAEMNISESRSFSVAINGVIESKIITNYSAQEVEFSITSNGGSDNFGLVTQDFNSAYRPPIINAFEYYGIVLSDQATEDIDALDAIKRGFDIRDWISPDPCYLIPWEGIGCDNSAGLIRISEIDLSGMNLTGSVPNEIANLASLVNVSLADNHIRGPMPNLINLMRLERLYLQNNNMNGTLEWLSGLTSLKELNMENNNFSGAIPAQLLLDCSLKLSYSGNPYLRMNKRECNLENLENKHTKLMVLLGVLLIALIVDQVVKMRIKEEAVVTESNGAKKETECSMLMVPIPTKSRAFTRDEMVAATQSFSREIGRGGFGSVFSGKLQEGKVIAVKVLSLFSRQGFREFLNEIDLLSKINHRNLVSLLGYCNETKEVMLIYEHMSGGSLRDHLYGSSAENSDLSWKRRLKIALDAAQGLEYLHVSCTPKIIHRDIKTSNILLDSNLNAKLADFGLSKMTIDGEATHVTTAVKGTFGYLDPEYFNTQMLTEKSDVYSFGVVLLEIICGRQPINVKLTEEAVNIIRWVTPYLLEMDENGGNITEIIDKRLCGGYDMRSMTRVARIAMRCVEAAPSCRPSVSEIVAELKEAIKHEDDHNGDLLAGPADSTKREGMEWRDNSTNISNVGR